MTYLVQDQNQPKRGDNQIWLVWKHKFNLASVACQMQSAQIAPLTAVTQAKISNKQVPSHRLEECLENYLEPNRTNRAHKSRRQLLILMSFAQ